MTGKIDIGLKLFILCEKQLLCREKNLATFQIDGNEPLSTEQFMIRTTCITARQMIDALLLSRPVALHF